MKKGKLFLSILTCMAVTAASAGCGNGQEGPQATAGNSTVAAAPSSAISIKIGHVNAPSHPVQKGLELFKEMVEEETGGAVTVDIYDSGLLGGELEIIEQVNTGSIDGAVIMGAANWEGVAPVTAIGEMPFMFPDFDTARMAFDGAFGDKLAREVIEPTGVKVLCYWENGFRHFTNSVRPIVTPEDMAGIKFRTSQANIKIEMFKALNASAVTISFNELYTALQQGTVDGQENPLSMIESSGFYEVQDYLSLSGHMYGTALFIMNPDSHSRLTEEQQQIVQRAAEAGRDLMRSLNGEEELLKLLEEKGMEINEVDKGSFQAAVQPLWDDFSAEYGPEWIELALTSSGQK